MRNPPAGLPPGPRLPRAVQSAIWFRSAQWMLDTCQARFGDMFTLKIANEGTWVVTSNPEAVKQVFTGDPRLLHAGEANRILLPVLGPSSVLLLDDGAHLRQRKLMLPAFHGERMQRYGELMAEVASEEIERWPIGEPYRLRPRMQAMTLEIILRAVFGVTEGSRMERLRVELRRLLDIVTNPLNGVVLVALGPERVGRLRSFRRDLERVNRPIYEELADRRKAEDLAERDDIMSLLLQATHEDGSPMSDDELRDELVTLLVAGHETTANALAWAVERLCRHPEKLQRLTDEVRAGESGYLEAVVQETLRLRPVLSIVLRHLVEPMEIGGRLLPPACRSCPRSTSSTAAPTSTRSRTSSGPSASSSGGRSAGGRAPNTYTWIPFGGGVRRCLGPRSPSSRCRPCCVSSSCDARWPRRGPPPSASTAVRSPRRRAVTPRWWSAALPPPRPRRHPPPRRSQLERAVRVSDGPSLSRRPRVSRRSRREWAGPA